MTRRFPTVARLAVLLTTLVSILVAVPRGLAQTDHTAVRPQIDGIESFAGPDEIPVELVQELASVFASEPSAADQPDDGGSALIINGSDIAEGEFPFLVYVEPTMLVDGKPEVLGCGGVLIAVRTVLTAAHCVQDEEHGDATEVYVGLGSREYPSFPQVLQASEWQVHPAYRTSTPEIDDIALLVLDGNADLAHPNIGTIPYAPALKSGPGSNSLTVIGWGDTDPSASGVNFPDIARKTWVQLVECTGLWGELPTNTLCAFNSNGNDSCQGDSGGPAVQWINGTLTLVALVSSGPPLEDGCGLVPYGIYQRVAQHDLWIKAPTLLPRLCDNQWVTIDMDRNGGDGTGTPGDDVIAGTVGPDVISAGNGNDVVCAREGSDRVFGGPGDDLLFGGDGPDEIFGNDGTDLVFGQVGWDTLDGSRGNDGLSGGPGNDVMFGGWGNDIVLGKEGNDLILGFGGIDLLEGGAGKDRINGQNGDDMIEGGTEADQLWGAFGDDTIDGGDGWDLLFGGWGADILDGGPGGDVLYGEANDDTLRGGPGNDNLQGGWSNDELDGGANFDTCNGDIGVDTAVACETLIGIP